MDCGIFSIGGRYFAVTTDPFPVHLELGMERAIWLAVHITASDLCTTGLRPAWAAISLALPPDFHENTIGAIWERASEECAALGCSIVARKVLRAPRSSQPMSGSITMLGSGETYVTTRSARPGDVILMTKSAGLEAAIVLALSFREKVEKAFGSDVFRAIDSRFMEMSTVRDSEVCMSAGTGSEGVTSMHDATEGGVLGALFEISEASGNGIEVYGESINVYEEVGQVCSLFGIDPLRSISEGTLIITARPQAVDGLIDSMRRAGIHVSEIGRILEKSEGKWMVRSGRRERLVHPGRDPYWAAFDAARKSGVR